LSRSAAQEKSEEALSAQARASRIEAQLTAVDHLYTDAQLKMDKIKKRFGNWGANPDFLEAQEKRDLMLSIIGKLHEELSKITNLET
jgi:hypothetical protein